MATASDNTPAPIQCPYCGGFAYLKDSSVVYRGRSFGWIYLCENWPSCDAYVGVHPGTTEPKGRLADAELRKARMHAHEVFDPLWRRAPEDYDIDDTNPRKARKRIQRTARARAYAWLADRLGIPRDQCHIGMFDVDQCRRVASLCSTVTPGYIRQWAKANNEPREET